MRLVQQTELQRRNVVFCFHKIAFCNENKRICKDFYGGVYCADVFFKNFESFYY